MFRPLGLLEHISCPDHKEAGQCQGSLRSQCPFSHAFEKAQHIPVASSSQSTSSLSYAKDAGPSASPSSKRIKVSGSQATATPPQALVSGSSHQANEGDAGWITVSHKRVTSITANANQQDSPAGRLRESSFRKPPVILASSHPPTSPVTLSSRNTSLKTLWTIFNAAYDPLLKSARAEVQECGLRLAFEDSLAQEKDVFSKASKASYRTSIITAATGIRKRETQAIIEAEKLFTANGSEVPSRHLLQTLRESCSEVGTNSEVQVKRDAIETRKKTRLIPAKLWEYHFVCPPDRLASYGYSVPPGDQTIDEAWGSGSSDPNAIGEKKDCNRCGKAFIVGGELGEDGVRKGQEQSSCHYHWGKKRFDRDPGAGGRAKVQFWTCCSRPVDSGHLAPSLSALAGFGGPSASVEGDETCANGPHVFKEDKVEELHKREGFVSTQQLSELVGFEGSAAHLEIAAIDCELGYTTAGMSMTRVTVLDESGAIVLDELVRPSAEVLDPNLRFSGVTKEQLDQPGVKSLTEVRLEIARFVGPDTIIIGHGLENDLNAMRLLHSKVIDTALLFPHHKGLPFRQGLKGLSAKHLLRSIQDGPATAGHSSIEDAKASLDLVKWKMIKDPRSPFTPAPSTATSSSSSASTSTSTWPRPGHPKTDSSSQDPTMISNPAGQTGDSIAGAAEGNVSAFTTATMIKRMGVNPFSRPPPPPPPPSTTTTNYSPRTTSTPSTSTSDVLSGLFIPKRR